MNIITSQQYILVLLGSGLTLLGTLITNLFSNRRLRIQFSNQLNSENRKTIIEKYEELFIQTSKYFNSLSNSFLIYYPLFKNEITYDDALDHIIHNSDTGKYDYSRIDMLLKIYFTYLLPSFQLVLDKREELNNLIEVHKNEYKSGNTDGKKYIPSFNKMHQELNKLQDNFISDLINYKDNVFSTNYF